MTQLTDESWWEREIVPAELKHLFRRLCDHYDSNPAGGGIKGNTKHLFGRHRSREWCLKSRFCTDRSYGTRSNRDRDGNGRHIRAFDLALSPHKMRLVSRRLDDAVRQGRAPMVAEWFGTFDNEEVTGWFEGGPSSADESHLTHVHVGLWTIDADDAGALNDLFNIMIGEDMFDEKTMDAYAKRTAGGPGASSPAQREARNSWRAIMGTDTLVELVTGTRAEVAAMRAVVDQLAAAIAAGGGSVDTAAILSGVDARLDAFRAEIKSVTA